MLRACENSFAIVGAASFEIAFHVRFAIYLFLKSAVRLEIEVECVSGIVFNVVFDNSFAGD
jgi:hypothetical protein